MHKTVTVYSFLLVTCLFLICLGTPKEFSASGEKQNTKIRETVQFPADFFLPNLQEQTFEFVYTVSGDSLQYELYRYPEFRILTHEEHANLQHPHTLHDCFFSYEQSLKSRELPSREQVGEMFQVDLNDVRELTPKLRLYGNTLLEYEADGITGYWVLNLNSTEPLSVPTAKLQQLMDFLKSEQIRDGRIIAVDLESTDQVWFGFPRHQWICKVTVSADDLASLPNMLNGMGRTNFQENEPSVQAEE